MIDTAKLRDRIFYEMPMIADTQIFHDAADELDRLYAIEQAAREVESDGLFFCSECQYGGCTPICRSGESCSVDTLKKALGVGE